eukprot:SAG11_NODE_6853_length_1235_cov_1.566021_2_plen_212_part_00
MLCAIDVTAAICAAELMRRFARARDEREMAIERAAEVWGAEVRGVEVHERIVPELAPLRVSQDMSARETDGVELRAEAAKATSVTMRVAETHQLAGIDASKQDEADSAWLSKLGSNNFDEPKYSPSISAQPPKPNRSRHEKLQRNLSAAEKAVAAEKTLAAEIALPRPETAGVLRLDDGQLVSEEVLSNQSSASKHDLPQLVRGESAVRTS